MKSNKLLEELLKQRKVARKKAELNEEKGVFSAWDNFHQINEEISDIVESLINEK